jgi:PST family polysaccharide transporter
LKNFIRVFKEKKSANKNLIQSLSYLSIFQVVNILVPIVTYPYLISVLGKDVYGLVVFAQAVVSYLVILINFGFNTMVVKDISIQRHNKTELSNIVSNVYVLKGFFFIISFGILFFIMKLLPQAKGYESLFFFSMWICLYEFLVPFWYFQGIEKMKYITYLNFVSRSIFTVLIFILIKSPDQYLLLPIINGIGAIITGIASLYIVFMVHKIKFVFNSFNQLIQLTTKALNFFISDLSVKFFASSNKVIIGGLLGYSELAYYDLAEKVIHIFRVVPLGIVRDSIYPIVAKTKNIKIVHNTSLIMGLYSVIVIFFIYVFAPQIIHILGGEEMFKSVSLLKLGSIIIFTTHISNYHICVGLWSFGYEKIFRNMMIYSSLVYLIFYAIFWLTNSINIYTIILIPIFVDIYTIIHIYIVFKTKNFYPIKNEKFN